MSEGIVQHLLSHEFLVNVLCHMLAVLLLYLILVRLKIPGALLAAAIFALHPVMVESVAWMSDNRRLVVVYADRIVCRYDLSASPPAREFLLDERVLVPTRSDTLTVTERGGAVELDCEDGSRFVLPRADVVLLPVAHSSAEELARYLCERLTRELGTTAAASLTAVEVSVAEAPGQAAAYRMWL